jgi:hypothetical protein
MTRPVYDCKDPNCWTCRQVFHTREGLTTAVVEEARRVREAERDLDKLLAKEADGPDGDDAVQETREQNVTEAEQDLMAMIVRLSNALGALDQFKPLI